IPRYRNADVKDEEMDGNRIDARWVDMQTVLYIDITALSVHGDGEGKQILFRAKDARMYLREHVTPLQRSAFVELEVYIPAATEMVLTQEYTESTLTAKSSNSMNLIIYLSNGCDRSST